MNFNIIIKYYVHEAMTITIIKYKNGKEIINLNISNVFVNIRTGCVLHDT